MFYFKCNFSWPLVDPGLMFTFVSIWKYSPLQICREEKRQTFPVNSLISRVWQLLLFFKHCLLNLYINTNILKLYECKKRLRMASTWLFFLFLFVSFVFFPPVLSPSQESSEEWRTWFVRSWWWTCCSGSVSVLLLHLFTLSSLPVLSVPACPLLAGLVCFTLKRCQKKSF